MRRSRPTEEDHGSMVWPVLKLWLDSDLDIHELAERAQLKVSTIRRAILNPGSSTPGTWGAIAHALGHRIDMKLVERRR